MNKEVFKSILKKTNLNDSNIEKLLNVINGIFEEYGEDFKIPALSDNSMLYIIKDKNDFYSLESFLLNRIIRNICGKDLLKDNDENIENTFLKYLHLKNYITYLKKNDEIKDPEDFLNKYKYLEDMRTILQENKIKYIISKKDLKDELKNISNEFLEPVSAYKKRAGEEEIEISEETSIDEVIIKSKKKHNAQEIREAIERDKELLRFEEETRNKQKKFPEGTNEKQIEKLNKRNTYEIMYFDDIKKMLNAKYNIYLFANLKTLQKVEDKYVKLLEEKIGKENIFSNTFLESIDAYEKCEEVFGEKIKKLSIPNGENDSSYLAINKILNGIEYGNDNTKNICINRLNLIFLEELSDELEKEYGLDKKEETLELTSNAQKEGIKIMPKAEEEAEKLKLQNEINTVNAKNIAKENNFKELAETLMADYLLTENKYQVSRRNEDEEYYVDLIHNIIKDVEKVKADLIPANELYNKSRIRLIIRMLVTAKLISFENNSEKNYLEKLLNIKEIQDILNHIKTNPYITALHRVAEHAEITRGTEEITRLEHDRKRFDDALEYISNIDELMLGYEELIKNVKEYDQNSFTLNANKDQILSKVKGLNPDNKNVVFEGLISLIKIIARQNNMYPTEEEKTEEGYVFNIDKKYITYVRTDLIKEIDNLINIKKSRLRKV